MTDAVTFWYWRATPDLVRDLMKKAMTARRRIVDWPCTYAYFHPQTEEIVVGPPGVHKVAAAGIRTDFPPKPADGWVLIKSADPSRVAKALWHDPQYLLGGPSPLAAMVVGSLLGGGLGYGTGAALEWLFPERYVERGRLRKTLGLTGLGLGAVPGLLKWLANAAAYAASGQPAFWRSLVAKDKNTPILPDFSSGYDWENPDSLATKAKGDSSGAPSVVDVTGQTLKDLPSPPETMQKSWAIFGKLAFDEAGGLWTPAIPVDAFNNAIWNDVRKGMTARTNPFGTKSPWGTNDQALHTPPVAAAAASGVVTGIQQMFGDAPVLHPKHFVKGLAAAGLNLATARVAGGILGALGGLKPEAQEKLQDIGVWAGLLGGALKSIF